MIGTDTVTAVRTSREDETARAVSVEAVVRGVTLCVKSE